MRVYVDAYDVWEYYLDNREKLLSERSIIAKASNDEGDVGEIIISNLGGDKPSMDVAFEINDVEMTSEVCEDAEDAEETVNKYICSLEGWELGQPFEEADEGLSPDRYLEIYDAATNLIGVLIGIKPEEEVLEYVYEDDIYKMIKGFVEVVNNLGFVDDDLISEIEEYGG